MRHCDGRCHISRDEDEAKRTAALSRFASAACQKVEATTATDSARGVLRSHTERVIARRAARLCSLSLGTDSRVCCRSLGTDLCAVLTRLSVVPAHAPSRKPPAPRRVRRSSRERFITWRDDQTIIAKAKTSARRHLILQRCGDDCAAQVLLNGIAQWARPEPRMEAALHDE